MEKSLASKTSPFFIFFPLETPDKTPLRPVPDPGAFLLILFRGIYCTSESCRVGALKSVESSIPKVFGEFSWLALMPPVGSEPWEEVL